MRADQKPILRDQCPDGVKKLSHGGGHFIADGAGDAIPWEAIVTLTPAAARLTMDLCRSNSRSLWSLSMKTFFKMDGALVEYLEIKSPQ